MWKGHLSPIASLHPNGASGYFVRYLSLNTNKSYSIIFWIEIYYVLNTYYVNLSCTPNYDFTFTCVYIKKSSLYFNTFKLAQIQQMAPYHISDDYYCTTTRHNIWILKDFISWISVEFILQIGYAIGKIFFYFLSEAM